MEGSKITETLRQVLTYASFYTISELVRQKVIPVNTTGIALFQLLGISAVLFLVQALSQRIANSIPSAVKRYPFITVSCLTVKDALNAVEIPLQQLLACVTGELSKVLGGDDTVSPFLLMGVVFCIWILFRAYAWQVELS